MPKSRSRRKPSSASRRRTAPRQPLVPEPAPGLRGKVERASAPALVWLTARPKFLVPLAMALLLIGGLATPPAAGAPLLLLLALLVGWLSYLSWPVLETAGRLIRAALLGMVLAAVLGKLAA